MYMKYVGKAFLESRFSLYVYRRLLLLLVIGNFLKAC